MQTFSYDLIIIGGGPAGLTAGIYAKRAGLKTVIIEKAVTGGQMNLTGSIENYPAFTNISGQDLSAKLTQQVSALGVELIFDEIESVDLPKKEVKLYDTIYKASAIIIATGAGPRKMNAKNEEKFIGRGVHYCALCDGNFYKGKTVVMAGGGNSAVEDAVYLSAICKSVTIVNMTPDFNAQAVLLDSLKARPNIKNIYHGSAVQEILGGGEIVGIKIKNLATKEITEIPCDGVFVAIGRVPNVDLFHGGLHLNKGGYIKTDEKCATNLEGIYAAGDVREKSCRQIITAAADGAISATAAAEYIRTNSAAAIMRRKI
jgi:thioredoxin reductase (NADPH)